MAEPTKEYMAEENREDSRHGSVFDDLAEATQSGGICVLIDGTHLVDREVLRKHGVLVDELYISQPDTREQILEIAELIKRSGAVDYILILEFREWHQDRKAFDEQTKRTEN